jgi:hypothetical protein
MLQLDWHLYMEPSSVCMVHVMAFAGLLPSVVCQPSVSCAAVLQAELFNPRCLFLFGTYTIGKERLFLHVAAALQRKVRPQGALQGQACRVVWLPLLAVSLVAEPYSLAETAYHYSTYKHFDVLPCGDIALHLPRRCMLLLPSAASCPAWTCLQSCQHCLQPTTWTQTYMR